MIRKQNEEEIKGWEDKKHKKTERKDMEIEGMMRKINKNKSKGKEQGKPKKKRNKREGDMR